MSPFPSLCLNFPNYNIGIVIPTSQSCCEACWGHNGLVAVSTGIGSHRLGLNPSSAPPNYVLYISKAQFVHQYNRGNKTTNPIKLLKGLWL